MVEVPAVVGVPVIAPLAELIVNPSGNVPVLTLKVLALLPPGAKPERL